MTSIIEDIIDIAGFVVFTTFWLVVICIFN
jgi:hypothetical protein